MAAATPAASARRPVPRRSRPATSSPTATRNPGLMPEAIAEAARAPPGTPATAPRIEVPSRRSIRERCRIGARLSAAGRMHGCRHAPC